MRINQQSNDRRRDCTGSKLAKEFRHPYWLRICSEFPGRTLFSYLLNRGTEEQAKQIRP